MCKKFGMEIEKCLTVYVMTGECELKSSGLFYGHSVLCWPGHTAGCQTPLAQSLQIPQSATRSLTSRPARCNLVSGDTTTTQHSSAHNFQKFKGGKLNHYSSLQYHFPIFMTRVLAHNCHLLLEFSSKFLCK